MPDGAALRPKINAGTATPPIQARCAFRDLKGQLVTLLAELPAGYPPNKGFVGTQKRNSSEQSQLCVNYAYSVDWRRVRRFNHFHFARLAGQTADGKEPVYSWVSGLPDTDGGTGPYVMYTTMAYLESIGFRLVK